MAAESHNRISPSGLSRVIACPGSVRMQDLHPEQGSSPAAMEGTAAHGLAERCLLQAIDAEEKLGHYWVGDATIVKTLDEVTQEAKDIAIEVSTRMVDGVQLYLDDVRKRTDDVVNSTIEETFDLGWLVQDMRGTADYVYRDPFFNTLTVVDYKNGKMPVEVQGNPQLMAYALGALGPDCDQATEVTLVVVQPNAPHKEGKIREWKTTAAELCRWAEETLLPAVEDANSATPTMASGPHCDWCSARGACPKRAEDMFGVAQYDELDKSINLPAPDQLDDERLGDLLRILSELESYKKEVFAHALRRGEQGNAPEGWKVVRAKTMRRWTDEASSTLSSVLGEDAYTSKIVGLGEAEKRLRQTGMPAKDAKAFIANIAYKPEGKLALAHESDSREAVVTNPEDMFIEGDTRFNI